MTLPALLGVFAALAFVLGLLFVALRLTKHLPALGRAGSEGPELRVLDRAGLSPKQGVATVRAGDRTLVVGYGDGGVRMLAEIEGDAAAGAAAPADEAAPARAGRVARTGAGASPIPFPAALKKALRRAGVAGLAVAVLGGSMAGPAAALPAATGAAPLLPQAQEAVETPRVAGPEGPDPVRVPGADFPSVSVSVGDGDESDLRLSGPVGTVLFVGFLTLLPAVLLLMTSFTRILVVLHLLKQAIGTQTAPPAQLLTAMALLLTGFVMAPTLQEANQVGVRPWMDGRIDEMQMLDSASGPFRQFMLGSVRDSDIRAFMEMQPAPAPGSSGAAQVGEDRGPEDIPLPVLASAFVTSELRSAFQMGFALFLPFVIIDIVVASVLMSMGMFMLPPVMVSLPFKLLLFVMVDGWALIVGSLVRSFG